MREVEKQIVAGMLGIHPQSRVSGAGAIAAPVLPSNTWTRSRRIRTPTISSTAGAPSAGVTTRTEPSVALPIRKCTTHVAPSGSTILTRPLAYLSRLEKKLLGRSAGLRGRRGQTVGRGR